MFVWSDVLKAVFSRQNMRLFAWVVATWASAVFTAAAWFAGLPVVGQKLSFEWLVLALAATLFTGWLITFRWSQWGGFLRTASLTGVVLATVFLVLGVTVNPVVVNGKVYSVTSDVYKQVQYADDIAQDLTTLRSMDRLLAASTSEAWARSDELKDSLEQSNAIAQKYRDRVDASQVPAGALGPPTTSTIAAAFAMSRALESRIDLLEAGTEEFDDKVAEQRSLFAQEWTRAGQELGAAAEELNIPLTVQEGPAEV